MSIIFVFTFKNIYTPSNQHFKAFLVSKFNSEISFLYQLFKENSNLIVTEPCKVICKSIFMIFIIIYIYLNLYSCIYTPSYQHFKAFPVSKFNSETSFLYQLFKENSNIIVLKPGTLINEAIFWFSLLFIFIHMVRNSTGPYRPKLTVKN